MCFVDFEKAFDMVRHEVLLVERLGRLRRCRYTYCLHKGNNDYQPVLGTETVVRIGEDKSGWIRIEREVRQGCVLSPDLFSLYSQAVMDEMEMADLEGMKLGGMNTNNMR